MRNTFITTIIAIIAFAGAASAAQLGNSNFNLLTTVTGIYSENNGLSTTYEGEFSYGNDEGKLYVSTLVDLKDPKFKGLEAGIELTPEEIIPLTVDAYILTDENLKYDDAVLEVEFKF